MTLADLRNELQRRVASSSESSAGLREALKSAQKQLIELFQQGTPAETLVCGRAKLIDDTLRTLWHQFISENYRTALAAVGGYGRGELHPASDIDLLIIVSEQPGPELEQSLVEFIGLLWDIGLQVGQSVRTPDECISESEKDVTVITNILESRLLCGDTNLFHAVIEGTSPEHIWPAQTYFEAKLEEQQKRHQKYDDTSHNLEPNIKEGPGGLRDIQSIGWVAKRHFGADSLEKLVEHGFLTEAEWNSLIEGQQHLWSIRFALHALTGREEDRLLFDYQRTLAKEFGYADDDASLAVEKFMQAYYRTVTRIQRLNEMLLQHFREEYLPQERREQPDIINHRFQARNGYLEVRDQQLFSHHPIAMLELCLLMTQRTELKGIRAGTIRLIREHLHLIDRRFRDDPKAKRLFIEILRQPQGITHVLRRMNRYGLLAAYIPAFENIVGRMQYDLFHVYTVDTHTLFVVRNLRRFTVAEHQHEFPLCSEIIATVPQQELLILAALFHDIAKGRGGDHSELGAEEALNFCKQHNLEGDDAELVSWLVRSHLIMSMTAQRKDIENPDVIREFAAQMKTPLRLDCLYLLTVADMRATNPARWSGWKNSLLRGLYQSTRALLTERISMEEHLDREVLEKQEDALQQLKEFPIQEIRTHWSSLSPGYFTQNTTSEIVWHARALLSRTAAKPIVEIRPNASHGGSEVLIIDEDRPNLFALTTSLLDQLQLNIMSARLETTGTGLTLNSFIVLDRHDNPVSDPMQVDEIRQRLINILSTGEQQIAPSSRPVSRKLKHFDIDTNIRFEQDRNSGRTIMRLETADQPGLLSAVGNLFSEQGIRLINAKIATIGEITDDVFFIVDDDDNPIDDPGKLKTIASELLKKIGIRNDTQGKRVTEITI